MIAKPQPPDALDQIESDLAAEDARVGEWPPPQWWSRQPLPDPPGTIDGYCCCTDCGPESVTIEFGPADDCPLIRDNHGEPVDLGEPWSRENILLGVCLLVIGAAVLGLVALGVMGGGW